MSKDYSIDDILAEAKAKKSISVQSGNSNKNQNSSKLGSEDSMDKTILFEAPEQESNKKLSPLARRRERNYTKSDILKGFGENARPVYEDEVQKQSIFSKPKKDSSREQKQEFNFSRISFSEKELSERAVLGEDAKASSQKPSQKEFSSPENFKLNIDQNIVRNVDEEISKIQMEIGNDIDSNLITKNDHSFSFSKRELSSQPDDKENDLSQEELRETADDYRSPLDEEQVLGDISKARRYVIISTFATAILFVLSFYFTISYKNTAPLPDFMLPSGDTLKGFVLGNTFIALLALLVNSRTVWTGLLGLVSFRSDSDTFVSFSALATVLQGILYSAKPNDFLINKIDLFFPVGIFLLLFNDIGKLLLINRIKNNFALISSKGQKFALMSVRGKTMQSAIDNELGSPRDKIVYYCKTRWLSGFTNLSYTEDPSDEICHYLTPCCILGDIIIFFVSLFLTKNIFTAFSGFTLMVCLEAPISSTILANLPLFKLAKSLGKDEAIVTGYKAVDEFSRVDTIIVNAPDMFKPENVILHGIKPFDKSQIENVIIDAASVLTSCYSTLSEVFFALVNEDRSVLKKVDCVKYYDGQGLSAIVDGRSVLIGNRQLMISNGIDVPTEEFENNSVRDARNIVYLSNNGVLSSMFIISYRPDEEFIQKLKEAIDEGIDLVVYTNDPNITSEMVADTIGISRDYVKIMPSKIHGIYQKNTKIRPEAPAKIGFVGDIKGMLHSITASIKIKSTIQRGIRLQIIFLILGYCLGAFAVFMGKISSISFVSVLIFHIVSLLVGFVFANPRKI